MNLIERLLTMRRLWPTLKRCTSFALVTAHKVDRHTNLITICWRMTEQEEILFAMTRINRLAANNQEILFAATRLMSEELGRLITMQMKEKSTVDLEEMIREAGLIVSEPPKE